MTLALREQVPLAPFTSWRVGGPARYFLEPGSVDELKEGLEWARALNLPHFILGKGSNLLISDAGFPGLVVRMSDKLGKAELRGETLCAEAGCGTNVLVRTGAEHDRGGLEFLTTIPGTVGGAVTMNAGAHQHQVADWLVSATLLLPDGSLVSQTPLELAYRYRHSNVTERGAIVVDATFKTVPKAKVDVQNEVTELSRWRRERQPQALSAGSVFTNPPGTHAGRLIEDAGLKGLTIGRAQVSTMHANFFVNLGGATAADLDALIRLVQETVLSKSGLWLVPEVKGVGLKVGADRPEALA